jgi:hypothetical protein
MTHIATNKKLAGKSRLQGTAANAIPGFQPPEWMKYEKIINKFMFTFINGSY